MDLETRRNRLNKLASRARVSEDGGDQLLDGQQKRQASASHPVSAKPDYQSSRRKPQTTKDSGRASLLLR